MSKEFPNLILQTENTPRNPGFNQVAVWSGSVVECDQIVAFEEFWDGGQSDLEVRVQFLEMVETLPSKDEFGKDVPNTGGRLDCLFAIHDDDISKFAIPRLAYGISWIEDTLHGMDEASPELIHPKRLFGYCSWGN